MGEEVFEKLIVIVDALGVPRTWQNNEENYVYGEIKQEVKPLCDQTSVVEFRRYLSLERRQQR